MKKKTRVSISKDNEATVIKSVLCEMLMSQPKRGGPKATPIKRKLLYSDVIMPRCSRSTDPVMSVFKQGRRSPVPIPLSDSKPMKI